MAFTIRLRRNTAANAAADNPVLANGEPGYETDTGKLKIGDGTTAWNSLVNYFKPTNLLNSSDVGLGNVDNTSDATKNSAAATLTNKNLTSGTNTFPTFNQNTTGSAAKLTTARNIDGQAFDGSTDVTVIAPGTHAATSKSAPDDADEIPIVDSAASNVLKKLTWANLKTAWASATATLTNKTISGSSNTLSNIPESAVTNLTTDLAAKAGIATITSYTTSQTDTAYNIPTGAKALFIKCQAGGGGGGSGRKGAAGTVRCGGGGGAPGNYSEVWINVADLGGTTTIYVSVGAGGAGATAQATNSTNGNGGVSGSNSFVRTSTSGITQANMIIQTGGGINGSGGTNATGSGGGGLSQGKWGSNSGASASTTGGVASAATNTAGSPGAGGAGGGITSADVASSGANSGFAAGVNATVSAGGGTGVAGSSASTPPIVTQGCGGGSGGASTTGNGGAGGNGVYGGGGGGGGAAVDSVGNSGAGGAGGTGFVQIIAWY